MIIGYYDFNVIQVVSRRIAPEAQEILAGDVITGIREPDISRPGGAQDQRTVLRPSGARDVLTDQSGGCTTG